MSNEMTAVGSFPTTKVNNNNTLFAGKHSQSAVVFLRFPWFLCCSVLWNIPPNPLIITFAFNLNHGRGLRRYRFASEGAHAVHVNLQLRAVRCTRPEPIPLGDKNVPENGRLHYPRAGLNGRWLQADWKHEPSDDGQGGGHATDVAIDRCEKRRECSLNCLNNLFW